MALRAQGHRAYNMYGPTETTVYVTCTEITGGVPHLGQPVNNTQFFVLDEFKRQLPIGAKGELYVAGLGVTPGYLDRPEQTKASFLNSHLATTKLYRTGDMVRWDESGQLIYLGRGDQQVKLRGLRVELGEITQLLMSNDIVKQAHVLVIEQQLVAYFTCVQETAEDPSEQLTAQLAEKLPDYMVPSQMVMLESMPLTINGKVDVRQLPAPDMKTTEYRAPTNSVEAKLVALWSQVLTVAAADISITDNFFALGGHSLIAAKLVALINKTFACDWSLSSIFKHATVTAQARLVQQDTGSQSIEAEATKSEPDEQNMHTITRTDAQVPCLSLAQRQMWLACEMSDDQAGYYIPLNLILQQQPDVARLQQAIRLLMAHNPVLRTSISSSQELQAHLNEVPHNVLVEQDLSDLSSDKADIQLQHSLAEMSEGLTPQSPSMLRAKLISLPNERFVLALCIHHIAADGWSMNLIAEQLGEYYKDLNMQPEHLPLYYDYARWQSAQMANPGYVEKLSGYWLQQLAELPVQHALPLDKPRPVDASYRAKTLFSTLELTRAQQIRDFAQQQKTSPFVVLQSAFAWVVATLSNEQDIVMGTPMANRQQPHSEHIIGYFVNSVVLRSQVCQQHSFCEFVAKQNQMFLDAYEHQAYPFESLVESLNPERAAHIHPLFQIMFNYLAVEHSADVTLGDLQCETMPEQSSFAKFDITLSASEQHSGEILFQLDYSTDIFTADSAQAMLTLLNHALDLLLNNSEMPLQSLPNIISPSQQQKAIALGEGPRLADAESLISLLEWQAQHNPDQIAVEQDSEELSFQQLRDKAIELAGYLQHLGVKPGDNIALLLPRSINALVGIYAAQLCGAAFVPLAEDYPQARINKICKQAQIQWLLAQDMALAATLEANAKVIDINNIKRTLPWQSVGDVEVAYLLFTSGSTGEPKGVCVTQNNLTQFMSSWVQRTFATEELSHVRWGWRAPLVFDACMFGLAALAHGARLIIADQSTAKDPYAFIRFCQQKQIDFASATPSFAEQMLESTAYQMPNMMLGGEALNQKLWQQLTEYSTSHDVAFFNSYGPTETTVQVSQTLVTAGLPHLGEPIANTQLYVLDKHQRCLPIGAKGELCIGGLSVTAGYLNSPQQTDKVFINNPYHPGTLYRTGDLVRWDHQGKLEFLGRLDQQVKLRGFRIELGEIEVVLDRCHAVSQVILMVQRANLVAFFIAAEEVELSDEEITALLQQHAQAELPEYMQPSFYHRIDKVPYAISGKLNYAALPQVQSDESDYVAPTNATERFLQQLWAKVLDLEVEQVSIEANFFMLGGHSLAATKLVALIKQHDAYEVNVSAVFKYPTVRLLASELAAQTDLSDSTTLEKMPRPERLPLSEAQQRLWLVDQMEGQSAQYNMPFAFDFKGNLDIERLAQALNAIVERHEVLRTTLCHDEEGPYQRVLGSESFTLQRINAEHLTAQQVDAQLAELAVTPFNLAEEVLFRAYVFSHGARYFTLVFNFHHVAMDGSGIELFMSELNSLYQHHGDVSCLPSTPLQYAEYAVWEQSRTASSKFESQRQYWHQQLANLPQVHDLPTDKPRPEAMSHTGQVVFNKLSADTTAALKRYCEQNGNSIFMAMHGLLSAVLSKFSGSRDIVIGTPVANRELVETQNMLGFFANTLVLRMDTDLQLSFAQLLNDSREVALAAFDNQNVSFETLVADLQQVRSNRYNPLFQILLVVQSQHTEAWQLDGVELRERPVEFEQSKFDLTLSVVEQAGQIQLDWEYNSDLFAAATIRSIADTFVELCEGALAAPETALINVEISDNTSLVTANNSHVQYPSSIAEILHHTALSTPNACAFEFSDERWDYQTFVAKANQLARLLHQHGVRQHQVVALTSSRSPSSYLAIAAVTILGAAYLPLDAKLPQQRQQFILQNSGTKFVLETTSQNTLSAVLETLDITAIELPWTQLQQQLDSYDDSAYKPDSPITANDPAYVIYTSGTTGEPKGVVQTHGALCHLVAAQSSEHGLFNALRTLQFTPLTFDVSVQELVTSWFTASTIITLDDSEKDNLAQLPQHLLNKRIERLFCPPAVLQIIAEEVLESHLDCSLREVIVAGEALFLSKAINTWCEQNTIKLWNHYGPTETHVACADLITDFSQTGYASIGLPVGDCDVQILDDAQKAVPRGAIGELYVSGPQVALGYLGHEQLSSERFTITEEGVRCYRTGDRVRLNGNNKLEYLGRNDDQVKIRGFRVELNEIDIAIQSCDFIAQARSFTVTDTQGQQQLAVAIVSVGGKLQSEVQRDLNSVLAKALPSYMVPDLFAFVDELPLTSNGKLDKAKVMTQLKTVTQSSQNIKAATTPTEHFLVTVWAKLLKLDEAKVSVDSNFFELGGHSLLATRMLIAIARKFAVQLPLKAIFSHSTITELAQRVDQAQAEEQGPTLTAVVAEQEWTVLSFAQERLWFMQQLNPDASSYHMPAGYTLSGTIHVSAFEDALAHVIESQASLRSQFKVVEKGTEQQVLQRSIPLSQTPFKLRQVTLSEEKVQSHFNAFNARKFDLQAGEVIRVELCRISANKQILMICMHHIATDGGSYSIFEKALFDKYNQLVQGEEASSEPLEVQYRDFAKWQREPENMVALQQSEQYWVSQLESIPTVHSIPLDRPRDSELPFKGGYYQQQLSRTLSEQLDRLAASEQASSFMLLHSVFAALLARWSNEDDIVVGTPVSNRNDAALQDVMGLFLNSVVLRLDLSQSPSLRELLQQAKAKHLAAHEHANLPFERLVEVLNPERNLQHAPLFQVMLNYDGHEQHELDVLGLEVSGLALGEFDNKYDLTLYLSRREAGYELNWAYDARLFKATTMRMIAHEFEHLLTIGCQQPDAAILAQRWSEKAALPSPLPAVTANETLVEQWQNVVASNPQTTAIVAGKQRLSYLELDNRASKLANFLSHKGVEQGDRIAICMSRDISRVVAILAVIKLGAIYVPVSTELPQQRCEYMVDEVACKLVLSNENSAVLAWDVAADVLTLDAKAVADAIAQQPQSRQYPLSLQPSDGAHIIFTSGSTGNPKGVLGTHGATLNRVNWMAQDYPYSADEQACHITSMAFIRAVWELFTPLLQGVTLHLIDRDVVKQAPELLKTLQRHKINRVVTAPSLLNIANEYMAQTGFRLPDLKYWFVSGEPLPSTLARRVLGTLQETKLINLYGSTEVMSDVTHYVITPESQLDTLYVPIGHRQYPSIASDGNHNPVPDGAVGEIAITGHGLSAGYFNRKQQTAEAFIETPVGRAYATGDLGRLDEEGRLHCLGRKDYQIKIRGYRIEIGEIEAQLSRHNDVQNAIVTFDKELQQLHAYILTQVRQSDRASLLDALKLTLGQKLPEYSYLMPSCA